MLFHNQTDLSKLTRAELELHAIDLEIEAPGGFPNKEALIEEIGRRVPRTEPPFTDENEDDWDGPGDGGSDDEAAGAANAGDDADAVHDTIARQRSGADAELKSARYRVIKAITLSDGRTAMPGEEIDASGPEWPARRPKQLVDSGHLRAI